MKAMSREDYWIVINKGYREYISTFYSKAYGTSKEEIDHAEQEVLNLHQLEINHAISNDQVFLYGAHIYFPVSYLSNLRSFPEFIRDMYKVPELLCEVISITTDEAIKELHRDCQSDWNSTCFHWNQPYQQSILLI